MIPLSLHPRTMAVALAVALVIGLAGAALPALRATRLSIVDSLKLAD
jgi:ABC-type antimicrobial peptide transport system permease subunit